jgi:hypothetical protein
MDEKPTMAASTNSFKREKKKANVIHPRKV